MKSIMNQAIVLKQYEDITSKLHVILVEIQKQKYCMETKISQLEDQLKRKNQRLKTLEQILQSHDKSVKLTNQGENIVQLTKQIQSQPLLEDKEEFMSFQKKQKGQKIKLNINSYFLQILKKNIKDEHKKQTQIRQQYRSNEISTILEPQQKKKQKEKYPISMKRGQRTSDNVQNSKEQYKGCAKVNCQKNTSDYTSAQSYGINAERQIKFKSKGEDKQNCQLNSKQGGQFLIKKLGHTLLPMFEDKRQGNTLLSMFEDNRQGNTVLLMFENQNQKGYNLIKTITEEPSDKFRVIENASARKTLDQLNLSKVIVTNIKPRRVPSLLATNHNYQRK